MKKPNILIIFTDQQHKYALGRVDHDFITPNLNALCDEGILFNRAYSSNPICGPYRGCLLSGKYTCRNGVTFNGDRLPEDVLSMAEEIKCTGYNTCFVGKWHLGSNSDGAIPAHWRKGFDMFSAYQCHNGFDPAPPHNNRVAFWDENDVCTVYNKHRTDATTDIALEKLDVLAESEAPFFCLVGYQSPHYPLQPLPEYLKLYEDVTFKKTPDYTCVEPYTPTFSPPSAKPKENCPDYRNYGGDMDKYMRYYGAMVTHVDASVGRIIAKLKEKGRYSDTVIIFTSDHGDMQGSHAMTNKCVSYEKSCGVPLVVRHPDGRKGVASDLNLSTVDITATVLDCAQSRSTEHSDGKSFLKHLLDDTPVTGSFALSEYISRNPKLKSWRMICKDGYKLTIDHDMSSMQSLFDLNSDPYELCDLKDDPKYQSLITQMIGIIRTEMV